MEANGSLIEKVARNLGLDQDRLAAAIAAGIKSFCVTFLAMLLGLSVDAVSQGATNPAALVAYFKAHALAWIVTNVAAPTYRSIEAAMKTPPTRST